MGEITLYTGGARSGKSRQAQMRAQVFCDVAYIATAVNTDAEMEKRIARHRMERPDAWTTYECAYDIPSAIRQSNHQAYVIDCVTVYIANHILGQWTDWEEGTPSPAKIEEIENYVAAKTDDLVRELKNSCARFIIVTNEVGMGLVPDTLLGRVFRDIAGRANQALAQAADEVIFLVSGIPLQIKG